jgi:hypothetical protein
MEKRNEVSKSSIDSKFQAQKFFDKETSTDRPELCPVTLSILAVHDHFLSVIVAKPRT